MCIKLQCQFSLVFGNLPRNGNHDEFSQQKAVIYHTDLY